MAKRTTVTTVTTTTTNPTTSSPSDPDSDAETFDIGVEAAEIYESKFVPAIFATWAPQLLDRAGTGAGDDLLDVACGTGIVARTAVSRVVPGGSVTAVDLNEAMLTVAARAGEGVEWRQGDVGALPFPDERFDAAVCQMAFMFFPDPDRALAEMRRVTRPSGTVAVLVPASLDVQPAYGVFVDIAARYAGPEARSLLGTYWNCGDLDRLVARFESAGLLVTDHVTRSGPARFDSVDDFVLTEVNGSPLAERLDGDTIERICADARAEMGQWGTGEAFEIPLVCHIVTSRRKPR